MDGPVKLFLHYSRPDTMAGGQFRPLKFSFVPRYLNKGMLYEDVEIS